MENGNMAELSRWKKAHDLFKKYDGNPILSPTDWPYPANAVFNPASAKLNTETLLLVRVEDMRGFSHLTVARSPNGLTDWHIDPEPTLEADQSSCEEKWGLEDPRIVWLEEQKQFAVTYVSFSEGGPVVSLAITKNFRTFARLGTLLPPEDKDACLFPRRFNGRFALIHRPIVRGEAHIWLSFSPDLKHWGDHQLLIRTRAAYWDCHRVGLACQPIETPQGWLVFYHGVRSTTAGQIYRVGLTLLDLNAPWKLLRRSDEWVLGPAAYYEQIGDVGGVVFPTGAVVHNETNQLYLYYGAADTTVAVAITNLDDCIDYIMSCPEADE
ncbi:MAG: glycosidase [Planctomycetes bacterium RBG_13_46_10]|nr:MAG: glycosidase [Planctomycetes bacterium RBG_13_46_10]